MKLTQLITESNPGEKVLRDPKMTKMLTIAMRHDPTLPTHIIAKLGPKPSEQDLVKMWSELVDKALQSTDYGDMASDGKFDDWITRLYINNVIDYEEIDGEGGDALGAWKALSLRGKLKPQDQDFNKFKTLRQLQARVLQNRDYRDELRRIKDAEVLEKHKRERKETTLIDDDRFLVTLPYNYGACYTFNNSAGFNASFCTGSSSGMTWFNRYAKDGPVISIVDKQNMDDVNGKWQIHAATHQINNGDQSVRRDSVFAELFPGLMRKISASMKQHEEEIKQSSQDLMPGGYKIDKDIEMLKSTFPLSWASSEKKEEPEEPAAEEPAADDGPGTYEVTHVPSNKTANITADSREHLMQRLRNRYPDYPDTDYRIRKLEA